MVIKTFNLDEEVYKQFSAHCKKNGISMSKRVENFLREEISKLKIKSVSSKKTPLVNEKLSLPQNARHSFSKYC